MRFAPPRAALGDRPTDSVASRDDRRAAHLLIFHCERPPEVVERPALIRKVRQEDEREAERQCPLNRRLGRSLGSFINGGKRPFS